MSDLDETSYSESTLSLAERLNPANWTLGFKLALIILLISVPSAFVSTYITVSKSLDQVRYSELTKLHQIASTIAGQIQQSIDMDKAFVAYLAKEPILQDLYAEPTNKADLAKVTGKLNTVIDTNPSVELLMVMDPQGNVLASSDPNLVSRNFAFREYFQKALQGRQFMTGIIVGSVAGNSGVFFANPVSNSTGQVIGVFVVKMQASAYGQLIRQAANDRSITPFLIDGDGVIIYHRNANLLYKSLMPLDKKTQDAIANDKRFRVERVESLNMKQLAAALFEQRDSGNARYETPSGDEDIAGFAPVSGIGWTVIVSEPQSLFSAPLERQLDNFMIIMAGVSITVFMLTLFASRLFVRPIRVMARAASAIEKGDYDRAKTNIKSGDEVGQLSRAFDSMLVGVRDREKVRDVFGRMVSPEVREKLLEGTLKLGGEMAHVSVLFSDIRGFSTLSENMSPPEVVELLNEYLTEMSIAVKNWGGYINNFIGDAIVVVFGVPVPLADIEQRAVFAALEMRERLNSLNKRRLAQGKEPLRNGVGISTGEVVAGQMGSLDRFLYTVIGDAVNVAARLETLSKDFPEYPILINESTYEALAGNSGYDAKYLGEHLVKGRQAVVKIWGIRLVEV